MKNNLKILLVLAVIAFAVSGSFAQDAAARVDAFVHDQMQKLKIPGVSLAVIKDGKPVIVRGYGLANIEHNVPVKPETIFQSGSVGKQFTAFAVMLLVDEGKIGLDDKIGKYFGEVPETWANVTVRNLLTHTGGFTDYPESFDFRKDYTEDDLLKIFKETPLAFKPGEKWQYSNLGFVTLGILIHKVTGKFYGDFLHERIFKPLGMSTARVISERDIVPNRAAGYAFINNEIKNQRWVSPSLNTTADGSLYLTVLDMIKWDEALTAGKLLSKAAYEQMWTPVRLADGREQAYGFGWGLRRSNGKRVIEHSGSWQGFKSHIARFPENRLTIIVFANSSNANPDRIANSIAALLDPTLKPVPLKDPDPKMSARNRLLFENVLSGKIDDEKLTRQEAKAVDAADARLIAHLKTLGPIQKFELIEVQEIGDRKGWKYAVDFDSMSVVLELGRDRDGNIFHFVVQPQ